VRGASVRAARGAASFVSGRSKESHPKGSFPDAAAGSFVRMEVLRARVRARHLLRVNAPASRGIRQRGAARSPERPTVRSLR